MSRDRDPGICPGCDKSYSQQTSGELREFLAEQNCKGGGLDFGFRIFHFPGGKTISVNASLCSDCQLKELRKYLP